MKSCAFRYLSEYTRTSRANSFMPCLLIIFILLMFFAGCVNENKNLAFSYKVSNISIDQFGQSKNIKKIEWINETLIIEGQVSRECHNFGTTLAGSYKVSGRIITLTVSEQKSIQRQIEDLFSTLLCINDIYDIRFEIKGPDKGDYVIELDS
jgi:hypothetical protein